VRSRAAPRPSTSAEGSAVSRMAVLEEGIRLKRQYRGRPPRYAAPAD
jgi:hypothetical protein